MGAFPASGQAAMSALQPKAVRPETTPLRTFGRSGAFAGKLYFRQMRYFFHLHNDVDCHDEEGRELADIEAAKAAAVKEARQMASESVLHGHLDLEHYIAVEDDAGTPLFTMTFGQVVRIINGPN